MDKEYSEGQVNGNTLPDNGSEAPETSGKTINISGKSFTVDPNLAQAYSEFTQGIDRRFDERSQELGALRQFQSDTLKREREFQALPNKQDEPDLSTLMYEDPNKFVGTIESKIKAEADKLRQEYRQTEAVKKDEENFWSNIWAENKDLSMIKTQVTDVIKMIGQKYSHLNLQNTKPVRDALAKETRDWMKGIVSSNITNSNEGFVEGASEQTSQVRPKKPQEESRKTTKQILEARRERKTKAII